MVSSITFSLQAVVDSAIIVCVPSTKVAVFTERGWFVVKVDCKTTKLVGPSNFQEMEPLRSDNVPFKEKLYTLVSVVLGV